MEKKKKMCKFKPADYDYMDNMPLMGWLWEFERRSPKYNSDYKKLQNGEQIKYEDSLIFIIQEIDPLKKWPEVSKNMKPFHVNKICPVKVFDLKKGEERLHKETGNDNIVIALFDLSAPESIDNMLVTLKAELLKYRDKLQLPKIRSAKTAQKNKNKLIGSAKIWKSYLIVFDLVKTEGMSYKKASDILANIDEQYGTDRNIERHFKKAVALINGDYLQYI
jgi:hypothetical protein